MSIRVLHLFSNAKWTGPAEPAVNLCVALRRLGVEVGFACAPNAGASINKVVETARDRGIEPILEFHLSKHRHPVKNLIDRIALARFLSRRRYDIVHCHLDNDHRIAAGVARKLGIPLVRSSYEGTGFAPKKMRRSLLSATRHVVEPSRRALEHDANVFAYPRERMTIVPGAVDTERFDPSREVPDARRWLGLPPDAFVVGIVARLQTYRHYDDFFEAMRRLVAVEERTRAIVVGRGTKQAQVGREPVRRLGLENHVRFAGYVDGENYVGMLRAFDVKVFLTPGTDGTCRAVREAMAMAVPVIASDRGMLSEIVDDRRDGFVIEATADALFAALRRLAGNRRETRALGRAAREKAVAQFSLESQARAVLGVYETVLGRHRSTIEEAS